MTKKTKTQTSDNSSREKTDEDSSIAAMKTITDKEQVKNFIVQALSNSDVLKKRKYRKFATVLLINDFNMDLLEESNKSFQKIKEIFQHKVPISITSKKDVGTKLVPVILSILEEKHTYDKEDKKVDPKQNQSTSSNLPKTDRFPRTQLLLSPLQLVCDDYPMPYAEGPNTYKMRDYVFTSDKYEHVTDKSPMYALDCEMCFTTIGQNELTRVSMVDEKYNVIYETFVLPKNRIVNYLTKFSGITAEMMKDVTKTLSEVQQDVRNILPPDAILIGQSLQFDLHSMKMIHPYVIDTSVIFNIKGLRNHKTKLAILSEIFLKESIQNLASGHDSIEDSSASMKLVQIKLAHDINFGDSVLQKKRINEETQKLNKNKKIKTNNINCYITSDSTADNSFLKNVIPDVDCMKFENNQEIIEESCSNFKNYKFTLTDINYENNIDERNTLDQNILKIWEKIPKNGIFIVLLRNSNIENDSNLLLQCK